MSSIWSLLKRLLFVVFVPLSLQKVVEHVDHSFTKAVYRLHFACRYLKMNKKVGWIQLFILNGGEKHPLIQIICPLCCIMFIFILISEFKQAILTFYETILKNVLFFLTVKMQLLFVIIIDEYYSFEIWLWLFFLN